MRAGGSTTAANAVLLRMRDSATLATRVRVSNFDLAVRGVSAAAAGAVGAAGTSAICKLAQPAPPQSQKSAAAAFLSAAAAFFFMRTAAFASATVIWLDGGLHGGLPMPPGLVTTSMVQLRRANEVRWRFQNTFCWLKKYELNSAHKTHN